MNLKLSFAVLLISSLLGTTSLAYEGPKVKSYDLVSSSGMVFCDADYAAPFPEEIWKFGPADSLGKCLNDPSRECNFPLGFVVFDDGASLKRQGSDHEDSLCAVSSTKEVCSYMAIAIHTSENGDDVVNVKTATTTDSQRVTTEHNYPVEIFSSKRRKLTLSVNGCVSYDAYVKVNELK